MTAIDGAPTCSGGQGMRSGAVLMPQASAVDFNTTTNQVGRHVGHLINQMMDNYMGKIYSLEKFTLSVCLLEL